MKEGILFLLIVGAIICLLILCFGGVSITLPKGDEWIIVVTVVFSILSFVIILRKWGDKLKIPVQKASAVVVEMRTETAEYGIRGGALIGHFAVFELEEGARIELKVKVKDIPILKEGMRGTLTYRRGCMKSFTPS